jgi:pimeloyl-ACP methyl ester carboxylesterase
MDYRGHGYSQGSRGEYRVAQTMDDLKAVVDTVKKQFSGAIGIYGYSMGAMLATAFAERDTRVKSLLCGTLLLTEVPPDFLHQMGWTWLWGSSLFYPNMKLPVGSMLNMQLLMSKIPGEDEVIKNDARLVFDYPIGTLASLFTHRAGVTRKTYPFKAAIIQGEHDEVLSTYYAQRSMQHLTHPFELKVLPKVGHMAPWEDPEMLASEVARWFQATLVES